MKTVTKTNTAYLLQNLSLLLDQVLLNQDIVSVKTQHGNAILLSEDSYSELQKRAKRAEFLQKYDEAIAQIHMGNGVAKTMEELRAMEENE